MEEVRQLWAHCRALPFPDGLRGADFGGVDLVLVDSSVAGCVEGWLERDGQLDAKSWDALGRCLDNLDRMIPLLPRQDAIDYFNTYRTCAQLIWDAPSPT
ncbi:hypothetical protein SAMN05421812_12939 [Asanoa hainanensis]|uniref:Uncharacterized protein n=1 Tax=Asanoa hainanensis TaxID=560556 RepID=A0A239PG03_9ACTN|nr:hypothetical protein SAMN05421812_12939 [Asanoa hainanensis]